MKYWKSLWGRWVWSWGGRGRWVEIVSSAGDDAVCVRTWRHLLKTEAKTRRTDRYPLCSFFIEKRNQTIHSLLLRSWHFRRKEELDHHQHQSDDLDEVFSYDHIDNRSDFIECDFRTDEHKHEQDRYDQDLNSHHKIKAVLYVLRPIASQIQRIQHIEPCNHWCGICLFRLKSGKFQVGFLHNLFLSYGIIDFRWPNNILLVHGTKSFQYFVILRSFGIGMLHMISIQWLCGILWPVWILRR